MTQRQQERLELECVELQRENEELKDKVAKLETENEKLRDEVIDWRDKYDEACQSTNL